MADSRRLVTVDYLEEYTKGLIDQTYTPTSENAQSGKAVAEALFILMDGQQSIETLLPVFA